MGVYSGPDLKEDGLVLALDGANYKSFKGFAATNLLYSITNAYGEINGTYFKTSYGDEQVFIPMLGYKTVRYCNIYNNYPTSGDCCPSPLRYGGSVLGQNIAVSSSTTYTYQIIYKTTSGYTHPNFMYRYEYGASGYVTEGGVHNNSNRTSLGDGWYHAWGQFTTQSTTTYLWLTGMWYYQYGVYDKISIAGVSLHQGTFIISPEHMLLPQENRGTTVATGGGWADLSGRANHGELVNGVRESSDKLGALVFDGTDDYVTTTLGTYTPYCIDIWFYNDDSITSAIMQGNYQQLLGVGTYPGGITLGAWTSSATDETFSFFSAGWSANGMTYIRDTASPGIHNLVVNWNGSSFDFWLDGTKRTTYASSYGHRTLETVTGFQIGSAYNNANSYEFDGSVYSVKVYVSQLTDAQVQQNFNATRSRFGI